ncbi:dihydrofolate reductase [Virgibacillus xinjiangensis]|uniref:Dihydrofolate reductase n=1 Tax=Virgibacillus xinjiangensis TaxID=393090 RepID=A0ABV7CRB5_9BACI
MISLLVAMDRNHVIGHNNDLPWHLPKDLRFFKETSTGKTIIMGRKTFESIGKVLPNRTNVVVSRKGGDFPQGVEVISDLSVIKKWNEERPDEEFIIIGGGRIFEQAMDYVDRMYITFIDEVFEGDTFFPAFNKNEWRLTSKVKGDKDQKNPYHYYFLQYDRL